MRGDYSDAVQILQELANSGDATAQVRLARLYHRGEGVKQDIDKAVSLYLAAAELGHAEAQFKLGNLFSSARGCRRTSTGPKRFIAWLPNRDM